MISQQGRQWPQCGSGPGVIKKISGIAPFVGEKNEKKSACFTVVDCTSWSAVLSPPIVGAGCSGVGGSRPDHYRLESPACDLLQAIQAGASCAGRTRHSLLAATVSPPTGNDVATGPS